jgi:hypothetical protein
MYWTSWPEGDARCPGDHGPVGSAEAVARLLHSKLLQSTGGPFRRSEIFRKPSGSFSNECGKSDGMSVVRSNTLSDDDLRERSQKQAALRPQRTAEGALVAKVAALREIEVDGRPGEQVVFIYDDPLPSEPLHAVLRGGEALDRPEQTFVRDKIRDAFCRAVQGHI